MARGSIRQAERRFAALVLLPVALLLLAFRIVPLIWGAVLSFTNFDGLGGADWVGAANYRGVLADPVFQDSLVNMALVLATLPVWLLLPMLLALLIHQGVPGGRLFRAVYFLPAVLSSVIVGVVMSVVTGLVVRPYTGEGAPVSVAGAMGAGLFLTALAVLLLAVLVIPLLRVADTFQGLIIAFVLWVVTMMPLAALLYRPDLFEGRERLRDLFVLGPNLIWFDSEMLRLGVLALGVACVASWGALALGARVFERTELR